MITVTFHKNTEKIVLELQGSGVKLLFPDGKVEEATYANEEVATIVFETNLKALEEKGFQSECQAEGTIEEIFSIFGKEAKDRTRVSIKNGQLEAISIYDADPDANGILFSEFIEKVAAKPLGYFSAQNADVDRLALHYLRRFVAYAGAEQNIELSLMTLLNVDLLLDFLFHSGRAHTLTHLEIYIDLDYGPPPPRPRELSLQFTHLKNLSIPYHAFAQYCSGIFHHLTWLELSGKKNETPESLPLQEILDRLQKAAPNLKTLILPESSASEKQTLMTKYPDLAFNFR